MKTNESRRIVTLGTLLIIAFLMPLFIPEDASDSGNPGATIKLEASALFSEFSDISSDTTSILNKIRILIPLIAGFLLIIAGALISGIARDVIVLLCGATLFLAAYVISDHPVLELDILHRFTIWVGMLALALVYAGNQESPANRWTKWIGLTGAVGFIIYTTLPFFNQVQPGLSIFRIPYQIIAEKTAPSMVFGYGLILVIAGWAFSAVMTALNLLEKDLMRPSTIRKVILIVWGWFFLLALFANYAPLFGSLNSIESGKLYLLTSVGWNFIKTAVYIFMPFYVFAFGLRATLTTKRFDKR